jgi:hypothetical protein
VLQCYAYVLPILLFGSECWAPTMKHTKMLEVVHSDCLRQITGVRRCQHHHLACLRSQCGTVALADMLKANRLRWLGHVLRMGSERLPKQVLLSRLRTAARVRKGRPPMSWEECTKDDLKSLGLPLPMHDLSDHCAVRGSWRSMVYKITHPNAESRPFHRSQASHQRHMAYVQRRAGMLQPPAVPLSWLLARQSMRAMSD